LPNQPGKNRITLGNQVQSEQLNAGERSKLKNSKIDRVRVAEVAPPMSVKANSSKMQPKRDPDQFTDLTGTHDLLAKHPSLSSFGDMPHENKRVIQLNLSNQVKKFEFKTQDKNKRGYRGAGPTPSPLPHCNLVKLNT
jgi:hypothetical protein